jgi:tRNA threonylcarbamoyladenosine biosynthesis protein TsaB
MLQNELDAAGCTLQALEGVVVADGPGSFTGLRVGASVGKALAHARQLPFWTAPSLLVMAAGAGAPPGSVVLALTDALRGDVYAAAYRSWPDRVEAVLAPRVFPETALRGLSFTPEWVVSLLEAPRLEALSWASLRVVTGEAASPRAGILLELVRRAGGARQIAAPLTWEPEYGRPAEAQARWEASHGRELPDSSRAPR